MTQTETLEDRGTLSKRSPGSGPRPFLDRRACRLSNCALSLCSIRIIGAGLPGLCPGTLEQAPRSSQLAQSSLWLLLPLMKAHLQRISRNPPSREATSQGDQRFSQGYFIDLKRQFNVVPGTRVGSRIRNGLLRATSIVCKPSWSLLSCGFSELLISLPLI